MSTAQEQILASIKGLGDRLTPVEGLMEQLKGPASKAGKDPAAMLCDMMEKSKSGGVAIGTDGVPLPVLPWGNAKGCGMGDFLLSCAHLSSEKVPQSVKQKAYNCLSELKVERAEAKGDTILKAPLAESSGITGGYVIPPQFANQLMRLAIEDQIVRPRASIMPMTALTLQVPALDHTTAYGAGNTPFLGGVFPQWTAEAATRAEAEPQFRQTELKAHELSLYAASSNTILADAVIALDALLTQLFGLAIGWFTDFAYLQGNGVGKPLGLLNCPAAIAVTRTVAGKFTYNDAAIMFSRLYGVTSWRNPKSVWVIHPSVVPQLLQMVDAAGRLVFQPLNSGAQEAPTASSGAYSCGYLFGIPVVITEKVFALGTQGDVLLADMSKYILGDRAELQIDVSPHVQFLKNSTVWRVIFRGDGQPWLNNPVTLADGTFTVSPFVVLK